VRAEADAHKVEDDSPTLRYQRPMLVVDDPPAPPLAPEPVIPEPSAEDALAAVAAVAAVVEPAASTPVLELPTVRPSWRRLPSARGRGGLAPGGVFAQPEISVVQVSTHEDEEIEVVAATQPNRKTRLIAGITLFLVLGASATVVAMMNGGKRTGGDTSAAGQANTAAQPRENAEAALLSASAGLPPVGPSENAPAQKSSQTAVKSSGDDADPGQRADATPIRVPDVNIPSLASSSVGQPLSPADFSSAGVLPTVPEERVTNTPTFAPRTVEPNLKNRAAVQRALVDNYPPMLRERGVSGTVSLWVLVDSTGRVQRSEIHQSSGNDVLDRAASRVVDVMQFAPAMNRDRKVSVWIQLPIQFKAQSN
jgi:TonB family protein